MNIVRRLAAISVALSLMFTFFAVQPVKSYAADDYENLTAILTDLGIYSSYDGMQLYNNMLSREEVASILSVFYGVTDEVSISKSDYMDVSENWSSGHIMTMVNHGIMMGFEDGLFRPQTLVTIEQAIKIFVTMTGYQVLAENAGGYPNGYLQIASQIGLLKKTNINNPKAPVTRGEFTVLLNNAVNTSVLRQTTVGKKNQFESDKNVTLLSENLNIYKTEGKLEAVAYVALDYKNPAGKDKIRIDNIVYFYDQEAYGYLGTEVQIYYKQTEADSLGTVLRISAAGKSEDNNVIVNAKDILSVTETTFTYDDDGRQKEIDISSDDLMLFFNGRRITYFDEEYFYPKQGSVRFSDLNDDGRYEYVFVEFEVDYHVDMISTSNGEIVISDKTNKKPLVIKLENPDYHYSVWDRDLAISIHDIEPNDVISVAADSIDMVSGEFTEASRIFKIKLSEEKICGKVTEIRDGDALVIDGVEYKVGAGMKPLSKIMLGGSYTFYLNYLGKIAAYEKEGDLSVRYGILQAYDRRENLASELRLRIFADNSAFVELVCKDSMKIDGYTPKEYGDAVAYLKSAATRFNEMGMDTVVDDVWQVIKYETNAEKEIISVDTILDNKERTEDDLHYFGYVETCNSFIYSGNLNAVVGIKNDTVFFDVPNNKTEDNNYGMFKKSSINKGDRIYMYLFDTNNLNVAKLGVRLGSAASTNIGVNEYEKMMIYEKTITMLNADGNAAPFICGTKISSNGSIRAELASASQLTEQGIVPGDFVRWSVDGDGVINKLEKTASIHGGGEWASTEHPGGVKQSGEAYAYANIVRFSYGKAAAMDSSYIKIRYGGNDNFDEPCQYEEVSYVYIYNSSKNKVQTATMNDIRTIERFGESDADTICAYFRSGRLTTVVIYR